MLIRRKVTDKLLEVGITKIIVAKKALISEGFFNFYCTCAHGILPSIYGGIYYLLL